MSAKGRTARADSVIVEVTFTERPEHHCGYKLTTDCIYCRKINFASQNDSITKGVCLSEVPAIITVLKRVVI